jgi:hypothetical protein
MRIVLNKLFDLFLSIYSFVFSCCKRKLSSKSKLSVIKVKEVKTMPGKMIYTFNLGPFDHDVKNRLVTISVDGITRTIDVDPKQNEIIVEGNQDSVAEIIVIDIDDSGNRSVPIHHQYKLVDVVPPDAMSVLEVVMIKEEPSTKNAVEEKVDVVVEPIQGGQVPDEQVMVDEVMNDQTSDEEIVGNEDTNVEQEPTDVVADVVADTIESDDINESSNEPEVPEQIETTTETPGNIEQTTEPQIVEPENGLEEVQVTQKAKPKAKKPKKS